MIPAVLIYYFDDNRLDVYIHDYLVKRKLSASARTLQAEAQVLTNRTAIDAPGGFLLEWWSVFWDIFIARFKNTVSSTTGSYNVKDVQAQQLIRQKQQHGDGTQLLRGTTNEAITRQSLGTTNALTKRIYESNPPVKRNPLSVANKKLDQSLANMMIPAVGLKAAEPGSDHEVNSLLLKGWPLMGLEQLQSGLIQQQSSTINLSHPSQHQLQRQILMLLSNQYMNINEGGQSNFTRNNDEFSRQVQNINQSLEQGQRTVFFGKHPENTSSCIQQQDKWVATSSTTLEVSLSNTSIGDDQLSFYLKPRRQFMSSDQTNSLGTAGNTSLLPSSGTSTPSISIPEDVISMPSLLHDDNSSKASVYGNDVSCSVTWISTQTADVPLINHGSANNSSEPSLSVNADTESIIPRCLGTSKDITFLEIGTFHSSAVNCCDLSSDGKLIANGGDKKVVLWWTDSQEQRHILEEHADAITDVRFGPRLPRLASSSLDKTIKIWDVHNPDHSIRSFTGHSASVVSLDFHPTKEDLICSCDNIIRFQPNLGKYLAAAVVDGVSLIDGHISNIRAISWNSSGEYLASLSEDTVKVWKIVSNGEQECMHERSVKGKRFRCCTFHPRYPSVLVVGSYECQELWHMAENKVMIVLEEPVNSLAASWHAGLLASATDNNSIRLWK
ncbi:unnamed protein product [Withania somnifera]